MARASTTSDVFNAVADASRRGVLDVLAAGELSVGDIVGMVGLTQPQVSKHLKVLGQVDLVRLRVDGRRHLYSLHGDALRPLVNWLSGFEWLWNERLDRLDVLLTDVQRQRTADRGDMR